MTKTNILLISTAVGVLYVGYELLKPQYQEEGLGEIAVGLQYIFVGIVLIPLVFGIFGFAFSKEKRLLQGISSFGISFSVMLVLMLVVGAWKNAERIRAFPKTEAPILTPDSSGRKIPLP